MKGSRDASADAQGAAPTRGWSSRPAFLCKAAGFSQALPEAKAPRTLPAAGDPQS